MMLKKYQSNTQRLGVKDTSLLIPYEFFTGILVTDIRIQEPRISITSFVYQLEYTH